ncbi:MAG: FAD-dependent monooxygenase [Sciscionella sp.]|nr:FAD-dependent monooxygenase [Sciscionella sp.]
MRRRAIIVGAGVAGLSTALALRQAGWEPMVLERAPARRTGGYLLHVSGNGHDAAGRLGVLTALRERHLGGFDMIHVDEHGRNRFVVPGRSIAAMLGERNLFLLRGDLEEVLYRAAERVAPIRFGVTVDSVNADSGGVMVGLSDGSTERAALLVGADGRHSAVRRIVFGPELTFRHGLDHLAAAFDLDHRPHGVRSGTVTQLPMLGRRIMLLTLQHTHVALLLYRSRDPEADLAMGPRRALASAFGDLGWIVPELLDQARRVDQMYFDSPTTITMPRWSRGRVVLVGDAAWALPPSSGYGASQAIDGAQRLGASLATAGDDVPAALAAWESALRPEVQRRQQRCSRTQRRFLPTSRISLARGTLRSRIAALPMITQLLMNRATAHD